jgi:ABC-type transport system involved in multi-copper enzyme maturation permease subunit
MEAQTASLNIMLASMPDAFLKAMNLGNTFNGGFEALLLTKQFAMILPVLMLILVNGLAGSAIAQEIDKDTILLYLTQPISRTKYYFSKYTVGILTIAIFSILSVLTTLPIAWLFNIEIQAQHFVIFTISTFLFGSALFSIAYCVSALVSETSKVSFVTTSVFLVSYVLNLISQLNDNLINLKYFSLLYYFGPSDTFVDSSVLIFSCIIIISTVAGLVAFKRRDISIR